MVIKHLIIELATYLFSITKIGFFYNNTEFSDYFYIA